MTEVRCFSAALIASQLVDASASGARPRRRPASPSLGEDVRVAADQLVDDVGGDVVDGEARRPPSAITRVEVHLEQQVAELLAQVQSPASPVSIASSVSWVSSSR